MASVILDNIPQDLLKSLEDKARTHERTLEEEIVQTLEKAVNSDKESAPSLLESLNAFRKEYHQDEDEPYVDPFENVRDPSLGPEGNPWHS